MLSGMLCRFLWRWSLSSGTKARLESLRRSTILRIQGIALLDFIPWKIDCFLSCWQRLAHNIYSKIHSFDYHFLWPWMLMEHGKLHFRVTISNIKGQNCPHRTVLRDHFHGVVIFWVTDRIDFWFQSFGQDRFEVSFWTEGTCFLPVERFDLLWSRWSQ